MTAANGGANKVPRPSDKRMTPSSPNLHVSLWTRLRRSAASALLVSLLVLVITELASGAPNPSVRTMDLALWLEHAWSSQEVSPARLGEIVRLRPSVVYVHVGPLNPDGSTRNPIQIVNIQRLKRAATTRVMLWTGGVTGRSALPGDPSWEERFFASAKGLCAAQEIDGIHVNIEPLSPGDAEFVRFMRRLRANLGPDCALSLAVPHPKLFSGLASQHYNPEDYRALLPLVDELVVMGYNTVLPLRSLFALQIMAWQPKIPCDPKVRVGIPAYPNEGLYHFAWAENVNTSLNAWTRAGDCARPLAVYGHWVMPEAERAQLVALRELSQRSVSND